MMSKAPLDYIVELAKSSTSFRSVHDQLEKGKEKIELTGLHGSAKSLLISYIFETFLRTILVVTGSHEEAERMRDDLEEFLGQHVVQYFPARDVLSFEAHPPSAEVMGLRLETLLGLIDEKSLIVVAPVKAILERVRPPKTLKSNVTNLRVNQTIPFDHFIPRLAELGFEREPIVEQVGQFSIKGGIVDFYPFASEKPVRLEFFGDTIESIRSFDIRTQRSTGHQREVKLLPCSDCPENEVTRTQNEDISLSCSLLHYLHPDSILFVEEPSLVHDRAKQFKEKLDRHFAHQHEDEIQREILNLVCPFEDVENQLDSYTTLSHSLFQENETASIDVGTKGQEPFHGDLKLLRKGLIRLRDSRFSSFIICDNTIQAERLEKLEEDLGEKIRFVVGHLHNGFLLPDAKLAVYTDHEIFRRHRLPHRAPKYDRGVPIKDFNILHKGDIVVHIDYGIGRFEGIRRIAAGKKERDCLSIIYQNKDRLYVPVEQLNRVQKYIGAEGSAPILSKLGGIQWQRTKERTKKAIADMAADLIKIDALRTAQKGHAFSSNTDWQKELEASFPYEETPDQLKAAEEVRCDMERSAPMDRLICGDVGYGKTEVAIRAAFKAVTDSTQVAILVPTTILAQQHIKTFRDRMKQYPVNVEMLSRFRTRSEQKKIVKALNKGTIDIVIGTHRLLQKDIQFKNLGLLIIDEEQRFGVSHKERLKKLKTLVDVLLLTATPIPRTLHMSLMGARDMSVINTAPKDRLPIQTKIAHFNEALIRAAILREIDRGGQVYFVHNRVQSIQATGNLVQIIVPEVSFGIAHGQMDERRLEGVMIDFLERKFDCLISTMIIEAGLDIPSVNTIVINRADRFGLAQLYQLRGRVGRSDKLAYAYLLVPPGKSLTETARQRLQALEEFTELGSGFQLAVRDLEIRGAGNILGPQQHGFMAAVGFDLYCKLLAETVKKLKGETVEQTTDPKIEIAVDAYIPDEYLGDGEQKMHLYQRLARMSDYQEVIDMEKELKDRFGNLPEPVQTLLEILSLKILAHQLALNRVALSNDTLSLEFSAPSISPERIQSLVSKSPVPLEFEAEEKLVAKAKITGRNDEEILGFVKNVLLHLV